MEKVNLNLTTLFIDLLNNRKGAQNLITLSWTNLPKMFSRKVEMVAQNLLTFL